MALKYVNGDSSVGIKRHVPVFKNKKSLDEKKNKFKSIKSYQRLRKRFSLSEVVLTIKL